MSLRWLLMSLYQMKPIAVNFSSRSPVQVWSVVQGTRASHLVESLSIGLEPRASSPVHKRALHKHRAARLLVRCPACVHCSWRTWLRVSIAVVISCSWQLAQECTDAMFFWRWLPAFFRIDRHEVLRCASLFLFSFSYWPA